MPKVESGNLYSIDFLDESSLYLVVILCGCVQSSTTTQIGKLLADGITVNAGQEKNEVLSFAFHKFAEFIGYEVEYTDATIH